MILAAVIIGLVTAWSFGPRAGVTAATTSFALFVVAAIVPSLSFYAYAAVGVGLATVSAIAARRPRHPVTARAMELGRLALRRLRAKK